MERIIMLVEDDADTRECLESILSSEIASSARATDRKRSRYFWPAARDRMPFWSTGACPG